MMPALIKNELPIFLPTRLTFGILFFIVFSRCKNLAGLVLAAFPAL
jgi:hypothetical protein